MIIALWKICGKVRKGVQMSLLSHIWTSEEVDFINSTFIISNFPSEFVLPKASISEKEVP